MGLLDRWIKKKTTKQLSDSEPAKKAAAVKEEKAPAKAGQAEKKAKEPQTVAPGHAVIHGVAYKILIRPMVTEKSAVAESENKYSFVVAHSANKTQIKQAVKELYGVEPLTVNVINVEGRRIRFGRSFGRRSDYKKAIVALPAGKSISIHEGV